MMHHHNDPCAKTSCILSARRRLFLSRAVCLPSGYDARHCHKIPRKTSAEKWSVPAAGMRGTRCVSHFWPRRLIRQMQAADVSRRQPRDIHPCDSCVSPSNSRRDPKESGVKCVTRNETKGGSVGSVIKLWKFDEKLESSSW